MANSTIEWTNATWNPVTGCDKISAGCKFCYAERMSARLKAMGQPNYSNGFKLTLQPGMLDRPLAWTNPRLIFVNSMSDLFHRDVPLQYIRRVFGVMQAAYWHEFQVLTKRADRLEELSSSLEWSDNVWMGVSVENQAVTSRVEHLAASGAKVKFLSIEPLIGEIRDLRLAGIDWVIVGGESGPGARPMQPEWATTIRDLCTNAGVPFFFKQWGGVNKKRTGRLLDGQTWDEMPERATRLGIREAA